MANIGYVHPDGATVLGALHQAGPGVEGQRSHAVGEQLPSRGCRLGAQSQQALRGRMTAGKPG